MSVVRIYPLTGLAVLLVLLLGVLLMLMLIVSILHLRIPRLLW